MAKIKRYVVYPYGCWGGWLSEDESETGSWMKSDDVIDLIKQKIRNYRKTVDSSRASASARDNAYEKMTAMKDLLKEVTNG
jgi:hypothetical protein